MRRSLLVAVTSAMVAAAAGSVASAHPLGNFTINHYAGVTVRSDSVIVDYVIDMAEIPAFEERSAIDRDGDGILSQAELAAYAAARCEALRSGLSVHLDARPVGLSITGATAALPVGQAGLSTLRLQCGYSGALGAVADGRSRVLELVDANYAERIGWREITARGEGVELNTTLPTASASARLTAYPQDLLASPLDLQRAEIRVTTPGTVIDQAPPAESSAAPATDGRSAMLWTTQFFDELVSVEVGAMAPAGAIARVDVRMKDAPPCALRAV